MVKRSTEELGGLRRGPPAKRSRTSENATSRAVAEIHNGKQIQHLLAFHQNQVAELQEGVHQFKLFLEEILHPREEDLVPRKRGILRDFLDLDQFSQDSGSSNQCAELLQALSFAQSANNDNLFSAIASSLTTLARVLSSQLDFVEYGRRLCRTILQEESVRAIGKGLSALKHKEHVIGPCLRLLTEIVSFDGGVLARQLYAQRQYTFDIATLSRNLRLADVKGDDPTDPLKRPSIRTHSLRYVLANLRFQNETAKSDIVNQNNVWSSIFSGLSQDPPEIVAELLQGLRSYVVEDRSILRLTKGHLFNYRALQALHDASKQGFTSDMSNRTTGTVNHTILEFIRLICTSPEAGVLRTPNGLDLSAQGKEAAEISYLPDGDDVEEDTDAELFNRWQDPAIGEKVDVRNRLLGDFLQTLRPYADDADRCLLLVIVTAAPELVADYFLRKRNFSFEPKLTTTWLGFASLLFSVINIPISNAFRGRHDQRRSPPPTAILIENVIPQPLSAKVLTKCLQSSSPLIQSFAIRILSAALQKLEDTKSLYAEAAELSPGEGWVQGATALGTQFTQRCPRIADVIACYRKIRKTEQTVIQKEATLRLLSLYHRVLPQLALEEKFDVSVILTEALQTFEASEGSSESHGFNLLHLKSLIIVAQWSNSVSWWSRPQALQYSPFVILLSLVARSTSPSFGSLKALLTSIAGNVGLFDLYDNDSDLESLIQSLTVSPSPEVLDFLDDCLQRFSKRPIKYQDDLDEVKARTLRNSGSAGNISLVIMVLSDQWPYKCKMEAPKLEPMVAWLADFLARMMSVKPSNLLLTSLAIKFREQIQQHELKQLFEQEMERVKEVLKAGMKSQPNEKYGRDVSKDEVAAQVDELRDIKLHQLTPVKEDPRHPALAKFIRPNLDLETYIADGHLSILITYLSSGDSSIRRQTMAAIRTCCTKLEQEGYAEAGPVSLLLREMLETVADYSVIYAVNGARGTELALPHLVTAFAAKALNVVNQPLHVMYPLINTYLLKGPSWRVDRLPSHLCTQILSMPPESRDDSLAYWREVQWLLEWLYEGLVSTIDMQLLRHGGIWERILALFFDPEVSRFPRIDLRSDETKSLANAEFPGIGRARAARITPQSCVRSLIVKLLWRATLVRDGADTLITRTGILAWLATVRSLRCLDTGGERILETIEKELLLRCDRTRLEAWTSKTILAPQ